MKTLHILAAGAMVISALVCVKEGDLRGFVLSVSSGLYAVSCAGNYQTKMRDHCEEPEAT